MGIATLRAMGSLPVLQTDADRAFIDAVIDAVVDEPADVYRVLKPGRTIGFDSDDEVEGAEGEV